MKILLFIAIIIILILSVAISKTPRKGNNAVNNYLDALNSTPSTSNKNNVENHFDMLFSDFKKGATEEVIREAYADNVYFNDTLKTANSLEELIPYMVESASHVDSTTVEILDVAKSDSDYYVRWVMDMKFKVKSKDVHSKSTGISQLRFDETGKITFHHDHWDSADGFYQHLPVVGFFVRKAKSML